MSSTTAETPIAGAAGAEEGGAGSSPASQPHSPASTRAVPSGVTVVFAERKRTGRIAGAKYKADGTPYKRPGPPPKPIEERARYQARGPLKRMERSYTDQKRREVVMFLQNQKIRVTDENDIRARKGWNGGREDQQPPEEPGYRWPTLKETSDWFKVPERTVHSWWKRRQKILGNAPKKLTKVEKRRMAEEEERRRKEAEERREQLSAIGWPTEALPEVIPGYEGAWQRASEDVRMQIQGLPQPEAGEMGSRARSTTRLSRSSRAATGLSTTRSPGTSTSTFENREHPGGDKNASPDHRRLRAGFHDSNTRSHQRGYRGKRAT
ncbi:hypothetical protein CcaCcLH18_04170 [Colletotrichum camelliae]|nr:hypothetical protein CcaCcLH18_04170 [Colletotrichum camelliae]